MVNARELLRCLRRVQWCVCGVFLNRVGTVAKEARDAVGRSANVPRGKRVNSRYVHVDMRIPFMKSRRRGEWLRFHRAVALVFALTVFHRPGLSGANDARGNADGGGEAVSILPAHETFASPPQSARPRVWWFWGETVTTDEGITKDLEALKRVGFGGVVVYEQVFTDRPDALKSLSPEWLARLRFAAAECARLGLSLEVNVGSGYVAGGPWITPALGMQRLVASDIVVDGGRRVEAALPLPPTRLNYYRDVAVLAYPAPAGAANAGEIKPVVSSNVSSLDLAKLVTDSPTAQRVRISPLPDDEPVFVQLAYERPFTARSITYSQRANWKSLVIATQVPTSWADDAYGENMRLNPPIGKLEASDDGAQWREVCSLPAKGHQLDSWTQQTVSFPPTTARFFRLNLRGWGRNHRIGDDDLLLAGVVLRGEARVDRWEAKSGNVADFSNPDETPAYSGDEVIDPNEIVDVSDYLSADGRFIWDAPPGRWTILRLGHTPTGARTKHGRPETMGLECDKLSAAAVRVQFDNYVGVILREIRQVPGAKLAGVNIDSAEHGSQNWTTAFEEQFEKRRGYALRKLLPVMMGRVVGSREQSDKILFDVRRTIADLMSDEYFGTFQQLCHAEGMTTMAQAPGIATCLPSDNIQAKARTDIPMGEFWMTQRDGTIDCKEAASAAHVYGKTIAAAEAFTGSKADVHPALMKPFADAALALGINRFVVLASIHQPWDDRKPGVTEDRFYLPYQRHNTWWEESAGFWHTLGRSSHLLQQGRPVIDVLYHLGNDTPLKIATSRMRPAPPAGYDYDVMGDEVLIERARVVDGRIVLPDGMSYRLLVLAGGERLTLAAARKLRELVLAGATVLAPHKPVGAPGFGDGQAGDAEVREIADELWGASPLDTAGEKRAGAGRVVWGRSPAEVLAELGVEKDFALIEGRDDASLLFAHRATGDADLYFVANHATRGEKFTAAFRVKGSVPELWDPETGKISRVADWREVNGVTQVTLALEPHASVFVVFRAAKTDVPTPGETTHRQLVEDMTVTKTITGPWQVRFTPGWGAPEMLEIPELKSWSDFSDENVRHYSGHAVYAQTFEWKKESAGRVWLDLGDVAVVASVTLNGRALGAVWKRPYAVDITDALRSGKNELEVRVANVWTNRLILDSGLPEAQRKTWVTWNPYGPDAALLPSGLLGPVVLRVAEEE